MGWSSSRPVPPPAVTSARWVTGRFTEDAVCYIRNVHEYCGELSATFLFHIYVFIFPLPRSSSLSLVWQNWCCRLTRETWTSCWDLWMITWRRPLWKKRRVFRIPTTTLRGPAPVSKQAHHSVRAPTVAKDIFSPPSSEML